MSNVTLSIGGRDFRVGCRDGQEDQIRKLGELIDDKVRKANVDNRAPAEMLLFAALLSEPWWTLALICVVYLALMPMGIVRYAKVRRARDEAARPPARKPLGVDEVEQSLADRRDR